MKRTQNLIFTWLLFSCTVWGQQTYVTQYMDPAQDTLLLVANQALPDSGAVLVFLNEWSHNDTTALVLTRINDRGQPQVSVSVNRAPAEGTCYFTKAMMTQTNELLLSGYQQIQGVRSQWIMLFDPQSLALSRLLQLQTDSSWALISLVSETGGQIYLSGSLRDTTLGQAHAYPFIVAMDAQGNPLWSRTFKMTGNISGSLYSVATTRTGHLVSLGYVEPLSGPIDRYNVIWVLDSSGNVVSTQRLDFDGVAESPRLYPLANGDLGLLAWMRQSVGWGHSANNDLNFVRMVLDSNAQVQSILRYTGWSPWAIARKADSSFALIGGANQQQWFMGLDPQGNLGPNWKFVPTGASIHEVSPFLRWISTASNGQMLYHRVGSDTLTDRYVNVLYKSDGLGAPACDAQDTTFSLPLSMSWSQSPLSMIDTVYPAVLDSFPLWLSPYPHPVPVQFCDAECVWPGDANNDGVANLGDLLNVGLAYGTTGPSRALVSNAWVCQSSTAWSQTFANGLTFNHADCDGDGLVGASDTLAILANYGLTHQKRSGGAWEQTGAPDLILDFRQVTAQAGDTLVADILLGNAVQAVDSIYGIYFRLDYDHNVVDSGKAWLDFSDSWIADQGPSISLQKDLYDLGRLEGATVRVDQQNSNGYGKIATVSFVLIDNIEEKRQLFRWFPVTVAAVHALTQSETDLNFDSAMDSVLMVGFQLPPLGHVSHPLVHPNPGRDRVSLWFNGEQPMAYRIYNSQGQMIKADSGANLSALISLEGLRDGVFILEMQYGEQLFRQKLLKLED